jgi:hypothetical protein
VFNWLGVTLPPLVNRIQARLLIISLIGVIVYFIKKIRAKKLISKKSLGILFLFASALIYYFSVIVWDYFFRRGHPFSFGIQGRYFFPTVVSHMSFMLVGLTGLIPARFKRANYNFLRMLIVWWFVFSLIGLATAVTSYYQLTPIFTFINQASQYKPLFLKGWRLAVLLISSILINLGFIITLVVKNEKSYSK